MCKKDGEKVVEVEQEPKPLVDFSYEQGKAGDLKTFKFKSLSSNYKELLWQLGDDSTSTADSITHTYQFFGRYRVILTARNSEGYWARKEIRLNIFDPSFDSTRVGVNYTQSIGGSLVVSKENGDGPSGGEGSLKAVDGNPNTKFLVGDIQSPEGLRLSYTFNSPVVAEAYTLVSGNDAPSRDPKSWTFEASENNLDWVVLDTRSGISWLDPLFPSNAYRNVAKIYHFNNLTPYKYYRLNITEISSGDLFQFSEWTINKSQPEN